MRGARCPRIWEAEALEDGRLVGHERLSFEEHVAGCPVCQGEVEALATLRRAMLHAPAMKSSPFERRGRRSLLLRKANDQLLGKWSSWVPAPFIRRALWWAPFVAALVVLVAARSSWVHGRPGAVPASVAQTVPRFEIRAIEQASWVDRSEGAVGHVALERGTLSVHVHRLGAGQRFLLTLPDGEIEVHGTRFTAEVEREQTQRVEVTEGVVSLRLTGAPERLLGAGERWPSGSPVARPEEARQDNPVPESSASPVADAGSVGPSARLWATATAPVLAAGTRGAADAATMPAPEVFFAQGRPVSAPGSSDTPARSSLQSVQFAEAIDALDSSAFSLAEVLFTRFAREFPDDARTEDAFFLRAVARGRAGDRAGASSLAREYLARFPQGLRRSEAERLVRGE